MLKIWKLMRNTVKSLVKKLDQHFAKSYPETYAGNFV